MTTRAAAAAAAKAPDAAGQLEITTRVVRDGTVVVRLAGEVDVAVTDALAEALAQADADEPRLLIIDLSELGFLDSSGFNVLTKAYKHARSNGRELVLANPHHIIHALQVSGLSSFFVIEPDVETAIDIHG